MVTFKSLTLILQVIIATTNATVTFINCTLLKMLIVTMMQFHFMNYYVVFSVYH